uniref:RNase H type-1 domain-containing protein n=1 Tax=Cajanus cajan TaxID=3821 RepID=A0A151UFU4_CAJCA
MGSGNVALGGLCRDHNGHFLMRFYSNAGSVTILHAEILVLLQGLELCWNVGYRNVICYSDSEELNTITAMLMRSNS